MTPDPAYLASNPEAERIYDNVQAVLPGVSLEVLKMELWNAIEEFALRSTFYRAVVPWVLPPNIRMFDFNPYESGMLAFAVLRVCNLPYYRCDPPAVLIDTSLVVSGLREGTALIALKPTSFDGCLPPDLFNRWFECMLDGTKGRLMAHPAKPYSSPAMAQYHMKRYRVGINLARAEAQQLNSGQSNFRFPYFAHGQRKQ